MPKYRVLVVDDDDDFRLTVGDVLERAGFEVVTVGSGADALAFLGRVGSPCVVVLDLHMNDMDGYEVIGALQGRKDAAAFPVLVVSGAEIRAMPAGVRWLRKPFHTDDLVTAIRGAASGAVGGSAPRDFAE